MSNHLLHASRILLTYSALFGVVIGSAFQPSTSRGDAAIAFGQYGDGGWASGTAYNYRTRAEAENHAMSNCNARGYNCAVQSTFHSSCAALAVQDGGNAWAISIHPDLAATHRDALTRCAQYGLSCSIRESFCDNVDGDGIRQAEQDQKRAEYDEYVRQWYACFTEATDPGVPILACNEALGFPRARYDDRKKLIERRDGLIRFRERLREQREREAREEQTRRQQATEEAARQAEQRAAEASAAARQAEQRASEAEYAARKAGQNNTPQVTSSPVRVIAPVKAGLKDFWNKPVHEATALTVFLFCLYAAMKEIIKAKVPPRYKFMAVFSIAFIEWLIFWNIGVSPTDPRVAEVIYVSAPLLGAWLGFEVLDRTANA